MPPKESKIGGDDGFLAACFRNLKEKPIIDFVALARETGMSQGGAANKFRAIMKKFEGHSMPVWKKNEDDSIEPKKAIASKRRANGTTKKPTIKNAKLTTDSDDGDHDVAGVYSNDEENDGSNDTDAEVSPNKKVKKFTAINEKKSAGRTKGKRASGNKKTPAPTLTSETEGEDRKDDKAIRNVDVDMDIDGADNEEEV